ncbi:MAG: DNA recombination protein RmuC [Clostridiales bacterium]|nr:DNA recombination protein RmuC [Clostridiales bacterium]
MTDYIILALLSVLIVIGIMIIVILRRAGTDETEDDGHEEEMVERLLDKLDENKDAVLHVSGQFDMMSKNQYVQNKSLQDTLSGSLKETREDQAQRLDAMTRSQNNSFAEFRKEMNESADRQNRTIVQLQKTTNDSLMEMQKSQGESLLKMQEQMNKTLQASIESMTKSNEKKLDEIRGVVTEKLDKTLNERLDSNFKQVGEQMANLYKSLGELQQLSSGVTNLNKTLSNVKARGNWGEVQLGRILEQTLAREQYEENIATKSGSSDRVEYAIKLPNEEGAAYLPIDAKFPVDIYNRIAEASENCDEEAVKAARGELMNRIKQEASTISDKYLDPPNTADYAIMYLPTEGLYAEVLRIDGLSDYCQSKRIMIAGPTTIMALLNTISIGFRHMALNKKSEEVRKILEATKGQLEKLEEAATIAEKRIDKASEAAREIKHRTGIMRGKMRTITALSDEESDRILGIEASGPMDLDDLEDDE